MPIFKVCGEYLYGDTWDSKIGVGSLIYERVERLKKKGFKCSERKSEEDPEGNLMIECYLLLPLEEQEDPELPKKYPGMYYWVWYNGAFFEVYGETEKYLYVKVDESEFKQAEALGIEWEKIKGDYRKDPEIGMWWLKKNDVKMPDEFGKGKYVYLKICPPFYRDICEVIERDGDYIRVRCRKIYAVDENQRDKLYDEFQEYIRKGTFPWESEWMAIKEIAKEINSSMWKEGKYDLYIEATFNLKVLRKYRAMVRDKYFGTHYLDFYLYGEEDVPYRL